MELLLLRLGVVLPFQRAGEQTPRQPKTLAKVQGRVSDPISSFKPRQDARRNVKLNLLFPHGLFGLGKALNRHAPHSQQLQRFIRTLHHGMFCLGHFDAQTKNSFSPLNKTGTENGSDICIRTESSVT